MAVAVATRGRMARRRYVVSFSWLNLRVSLQARRSQGYLAGSLRITRGPTFWTLTLWEDARAMKRFRDSGAHAASMPYTEKWSAEATFAVWTADALPTWEEAERELESRGHSPLEQNLPAPDRPGGRSLALSLPPARS